MQKITTHNPQRVFPPYSNYAHAVQVPAGARTLYISGLNGYESDGTTMPPNFKGQLELIWEHLESILRDAEMTVQDLVSLRFYLASAAHDPENVEVLRRRLGEHRCARTVVCQELLEPEWLVEVEAIAARL